MRLSPSDFGGGCCCPRITSGQAEVQRRGTCPGSHCQLQVRGWEAVRMTVAVEGPKVLGWAKPRKWAPAPSMPQFPCKGSIREFQRPAATARLEFLLVRDLCSLAEAPPAWARQTVLGVPVDRDTAVWDFSPVLSHPALPAPPQHEAHSKC